jgi:hypothetical protein
MTRLASKLTLSKFVLHCFLFTNFFLLVSWILQYFGIWHVVVAFILGILTTLGAITCAIYYLLGRIDKKLQQRHQSILQANLDFKNHPNWAFALEKTVAEDESKPIAIEGTLEVQFGGKRKTKMPYLCCLKGTTLYLQKKKMSKIIGIPLEGAEIRKVDEKVFKTKNCLEIMHPLRQIMYRVDYIYLSSDSMKDIERWYFFLRKVCKEPKNPNSFVPVPSAYQLHATSDTVHNNNNNNVQNQPIIETAKWFNVVAERFFLNIRESEEVEKKLVSKLITKFSEKLTEKGWGDMISQMSITDVELGTKPPTIEEVAILPPDGTGDLALDVTLSYSGGGAKLSIAADVNFKNFFSTTVT